MSMRKCTVLFFLLATINTYAQKQYEMGKETLFVPGTVVSTIKLVDYAGKQIGNILTHTFFDSKKAVFTHIATEKNTPRLLILQVITKEAAKGLVADFEVKKAFVDPEEKTNPKNYWQVLIGFRKQNDEVVEVGSTEYYKKEGDTVIKNVYRGTSYAVSFISKTMADEFVTKLKAFINE